MAERLRAFIDYTGLTDKDFGLQFNVSKQEVSNWINGRRISLAKLNNMLEVFSELNGHWFLTGKGDMLNDFTDGDKANPENDGIDKEKDLLNKESAKTEEKSPESFTPKKTLQLQSENILKDEIISLQHDKIKWLEEKLDALNRLQDTGVK